MRCSRCQQDNPANQKFCGECGARCTRRRTSDREDWRRRKPGSRSPGAPLDRGQATPKPASPEAYTPKHLAERIKTSRVALEGERKQVTVLFADIKGSLELIESSDPEQAQLLLDSVLGAMMDAVHRYEARSTRSWATASWRCSGRRSPTRTTRFAHATALAMQDTAQRVAAQARATFGVEPQIRVGLHSGEVVVRAIGNDLSIDYDAIGPTAHLAGRMEQLAIPGTIHLGRPDTQIPICRPGTQIPI
jgi:class 3 adenylate cyclase